SNEQRLLAVMSNMDKSERLSFTQLLLPLLALSVCSIIAAVIVASLLVDPLEHFLRWVAAFLLIALSIFGAAGYVIMSRFLGKSGISADVHVEGRDRSLPRIPPAVSLRQGDGDEQFRAVAETASDGIISAEQNGN